MNVSNRPHFYIVYKAYTYIWYNIICVYCMTLYNRLSVVSVRWSYFPEKFNCHSVIHPQRGLYLTAVTRPSQNYEKDHTSLLVLEGSFAHHYASNAVF